MMAWALFSFFSFLGGRLRPLGPCRPEDCKNERNKGNAIVQPPKSKLYYVKTKFLPGPSWTSPPKLSKKKASPLMYYDAYLLGIWGTPLRQVGRSL